jgi:hypothetical protein
LNSTIWTNNKAFKSGLLDSNLSHRCDEVDCSNYSGKLWLEIGQTLISSITQYANVYTGRIELTSKEIIFNKPHPAILHRINDKLVRNVVLIFIQEVKRDIFFRRMQIKKPQKQEVLKIRIQAHILPVLQKLTALLEYQGIVQNAAPISFFFLRLLQETAMSLNPVFKFTDCLLVPVPAESANTHTSISYPSHTVSLLFLPPTHNYSMLNCYQFVYFCNTRSYNIICLF